MFIFSKDSLLQYFYLGTPVLFQYLKLHFPSNDI